MQLMFFQRTFVKKSTTLDLSMKFNFITYDNNTLTIDKKEYDLEDL